MSAPTPDRDGVVDRSPGRDRGPPSRYDVVLAVIPLAFVLAVVAGEALGVVFHDALFVASLVSAAAVTDLLFVNPP